MSDLFGRLRTLITWPSRIGARPELFEIARLTLRPDDRVVIKLPSGIKQGELQDLVEKAKGIFKGHQVIVLAHGYDLRVIASIKEQLIEAKDIERHIRDEHREVLD